MPVHSREEAARIEVGQTTIDPVVASVLTVIFLAFLLGALGLQCACGAAASEGQGPAGLWSTLRAAGHELWPGAGSDGRGGGRLLSRIVAANRTVLAALRAVDNELDHDSVVGRFLRPGAQHVLSVWLGAGNEQAYCGREGWLFFRPDVEYLTAPGFLDPSRLARRTTAGDEWTLPPQPDPRAAIREFTRYLAARGVTLVVVPTPVKPAIHPEKLARSYGAEAAALQNPSYDAAIRDFGSSGALVFDPSDALRRSRSETGRSQYLATDTHWRPETMEQVADLLAGFVQQHAVLPEIENPGYQTERLDVLAFGDLRRMLDLPASTSRYPRETVAIRRVLRPDGSPWRPERSADVIVLGDSFSTIYSLSSMGWGDSAGFVEQLSLALRRPIDRIVENDNGAFATRARLHREIASGVDRLAGKRVVIYQFSARELAFGDWQLLAQ